MRRVDLVRVYVGPRGTRAVVEGARHRAPASVPVPLRVASALAADGVPVLVRRVSGEGA